MAAGLFQIIEEVKKARETSPVVEQLIRLELDWFDKHLPAPHRLNRTRSKGWYRRNPKGICWFKESAIDCVTRMYVLKRIAEDHGYFITVIREDRIGYIVYEDDFQAVAEPFSDTRTT